MAKQNKRKLKYKIKNLADNMNEFNPEIRNDFTLNNPIAPPDSSKIPHKKETKKAHNYTTKKISSVASASSMETTDPYKQYEQGLLMAGLSPTTKELIRKEIPPFLEAQERARLRRIRNKPISDKAKSKAIRESKPIVLIARTPTSSTASTTSSLKSTLSSVPDTEKNQSIHEKVHDVMRPIFSAISQAWSTFPAFRHTPKILPTIDNQNLEN